MNGMDSWSPGELLDCQQTSMLIPDMTLIVALPGTDTCVLCADSLGLLTNYARRDNCDKLWKIGRDCAVGFSGRGDVAHGIVREMGWINRDSYVDVIRAGGELADKFRAYCQPEDRRDIAMSAMLAGFSQGIPFAVRIEKPGGYPTAIDEAALSIGITQWADGILNKHFPKSRDQRKTRTLDLLGILCVLATSRYSYGVGGAVQLLNVSDDGVRPLEKDILDDYVERVSNTIGELETKTATLLQS